MGHIDPGTGRNKRETGKLMKRRDRIGRGGGMIRRRAGWPIERRLDLKRRNRTSGRKR
jgi:hypothetical protein